MGESMNKSELKAILEKDEEKTFSHACKDLPKGETYNWIPRKPNPKQCPRCSTRLWRVVKNG